MILVQFLILSGGCYYTHLAVGQSRLLLAGRPVEDVLADPTTTSTVKRRLNLVIRALKFGNELGLNVGQRYRNYVDWPGDGVVTVVMAAKPSTLEAHQFKFPLVGHLPYKGFFDSERARREAENLIQRGYDTCVFSTPAYSTLGWFDDPVTGPMIRLGDYELVQIIFHELVHATVFATDNVEFNEGFATFFSEEATVRFERKIAGSSEFTKVLKRQRFFAQELVDFRGDVEELYRSTSSTIRRERERKELEARFREELEEKIIGSARFVSLKLNDACLVLSRTYSEDSLRYSRLLGLLKNDLKGFLRLAIQLKTEEDPLKALETLVKVKQTVAEISN